MTFSIPVNARIKRLAVKRKRKSKMDRNDYIRNLTGASTINYAAEKAAFFKGYQPYTNTLVVDFFVSVFFSAIAGAILV